jgi:hypothetical protein
MKRTWLIAPLLFILFIGLVSFSVPAQTHAQASAWQLILYDKTENRMLLVTSTGITDFMPPEFMAQLPTVLWETGHVTADFRYVTAVTTEGLAIIVEPGNLDNCCQYSRIAPGFIGDSTVEVSISPLNPIDEYFVAAGAYLDENNEILVMLSSVLYEPGNIVPVLNVDESVAGWVPDFVRWTPEGSLLIAFHPPFETHNSYGSLWRFEFEGEEHKTVSSREYLGYYDTSGIDQLESSREIVVGDIDENFPANDGEFPTYNVIKYLPALPANRAPNGWPEGGTVLYASPPEDPWVDEPHWVLDGRAFMAFSSEGMVIIYGDERKEVLPWIETYHWVAGTPDGFVVIDISTDDLVHYYENASGSFDHNTIGHLTTGTNSSFVTILYRPTLTGIFNPALATTQSIPDQTSAPDQASETTSFPSTPPEIAADGSVVCPGFLPSRLTVGEKVDVVISTKVYTDPSLSSTALIQIDPAPYARPLIVSGPVCADNTAWWETYYNGPGWMPEGMGSEYWLAPRTP